MLLLKSKSAKKHEEHIKQLISLNDIIYASINKLPILIKEIVEIKATEHANRIIQEEMTKILVDRMFLQTIESNIGYNA